MRLRLPDPVAIKKCTGRRVAVIQATSAGILASAMAMAAIAYSDLGVARQSLAAAESGAAMLPGELAPRKTPVIDPKRKAYFLELQQTSQRLSVDWSSRLADLERLLGDDIRLTSFRLDAQRNEIEIKGEVESVLKLTSLVKRLSQTSIEAKINRVAALSLGFEYVLLVSWSK